MKEKFAMTDAVVIAKRWQPLVLLVAVLLIAGCQDAEPAPKVSVQVTDGKGYRAVLDRLAGKVVLVDFWASW